MSRCLLTQVRRQGDGLGTPIDLLMVWGAVAGGVIGGTVEELAAVARTERVGTRGEGVAPFRAQLIWKDTVNERSLGGQTDTVHSQYA